MTLTSGAPSSNPARMIEMCIRPPTAPSPMPLSRLQNKRLISDKKV